ncbi:MAG: hypothetical protein E6L02_07065 [Thaumarchaeota archaeon]|nr:MAG: hypothetical protein E6L02_07065 [Nitrososphaerota archaeon]
MKTGSKIEGPVIIGDNCLIDSETYVGPNTSIGENSKLSKCNVANSIIMSNCVIDCHLNIRDSIISFNSQINSKKSDSESKLFLLGEGTKISL